MLKQNTINLIQFVVVILQKTKLLEIFFNDLKEIYQKLWDIEDKILNKARNKNFEKEFINLARNAYIINDERSRIKRNANKLLDQQLLKNNHIPNIKNIL